MCSSVVRPSLLLVTFSLFFPLHPATVRPLTPFGTQETTVPPTILVLQGAARAPLQSQHSMQRYRTMHIRYISEGELFAIYFPFAPSARSFLCRCISATPTLFFISVGQTDLLLRGPPPSKVYVRLRNWLYRLGLRRTSFFYIECQRSQHGY